MLAFSEVAVKNRLALFNSFPHFDRDSRICPTRFENDSPQHQPSEPHGFAFAARATDNGAVVVRVFENTSLVCPQKEYGRFDTWTQAQVFASLLNQEYGIDPAEARYIVVSATLAACKSAKQKL
jgi:hypothetical protein